MIECGRQPACAGVTVIAGIGADDVRSVLSGGNDPIMAGATGAEHLGVIDGRGRRKQSRCMAVFADICRL